MSEIQAIQAAAAGVARGHATTDWPGVRAPAAPSFSQWVASGVGDVNRQLLAAQHDLQALAVGDVQNLHHVMIRLEESKLSFQLMMQVRNRLLESYQDLMKMQI
jgi:flagellar hook-basal body complex protein FliE